MRLFSNLPLILLLIVLWPVILLGLLMACSALERRTLVAREVVPRRSRRMRRAPERVEAMVLKKTADIVARYWSSTGMSPNGAFPGTDGNRSSAVTRPAAAPRHPQAS
jgi:hypothetical protein